MVFGQHMWSKWQNVVRSGRPTSSALNMRYYSIEFFSTLMFDIVEFLQHDKREQECFGDHKDDEYACELHEQWIPVGVHDAVLLHISQVRHKVSFSHSYWISTGLLQMCFLMSIFFLILIVTRTMHQSRSMTAVVLLPLSQKCRLSSFFCLMFFLWYRITSCNMTCWQGVFS